MTTSVRKTSEAITKEGSGALIYLVEELSNARLHCSQLKQYLQQVTKLVDESEKRDHIFEVAGQLVYAIPDTLLKLESALNTTALAASKLDYEELKLGLRPEKLQELENVLEDVRIRYLNRRSDEAPMSVSPKNAADRLTEIAKEVEASGDVRTALASLANLITEVEPRPKKAESRTIASMLRALADELRTNKKAKRNALSTTLRQVFAETMLSTEDRKPPVKKTSSETKVEAQPQETPVKYASLEDHLAHIIVNASSEEEVREKFKKANPKMTDEDLDAAASAWSENKDNFTKEATDKEEVREKFEKSNPDLTDKQLDAFADNWDKNKNKLKSASDVESYYAPKQKTAAQVAHVDQYYTRKGK